jgi:DNA-binding transcriptional LysR family regulator
VRFDIDLKHLRYLLAVANEGTFTKAAEHLGMTQPALSRAIRSLEDEVRTALFIRSPQGAELTEAGRVLSQEARNLVESADAALARVARFGREGPQLRVTARGCDIDVLHQLVISYNERFPGGLSACGGMVDWRVQADQVRAGEADVTLLRVPFDPRGLDSELVRTDPRVAVLPDTHPLAGRAGIHRSELAGESFPVWPNLTPAEMRYWLGTDLADYDWQPGPVVHDAAQFIGSIRLGHGVGLLAAAHVPEHLPTGITVVPVVGLSPSRLRIVWATSAISPDVARFVRHATEHATAVAAVDVGGREQHVFGRDWRRQPVEQWVEHRARTMVAPAAGWTGAPAAGGSGDERGDDPPRAAFEAGVLDALRTWHIPREFATSVLLRSHLVPQGSADPVADLRGAITTALDALPVDPAGVKAHEALTATYITVSRTHKAAARRLGVPYGTYRRHLALAKERLIERLLQQPATVPVPSAAPHLPGGAAERGGA